MKELPPDYYLRNFRALCDAAHGQYADLLTVDEEAFYRDFAGLDRSAQQLYVRLVSRAGPQFRMDRLCYLEIGDPRPPARALLEISFLTEVDELSVAELGRLYRKSELQQVFAAEIRLPRSVRKASLLEAIAERGLTEKALFLHLQAWRAQRIIRPLKLEMVELFRLLFFGNSQQSLTEFVLSELGVTRHYPYRLDREQRLFEDRDVLDDHRHCTSLARRLEEHPRPGETQVLVEVARAVLERGPGPPANRPQWDRLRNALARELERHEVLELAAALYEASSSHPARERRVRILERQQRWQDARALCDGIVSGPYCEEELDAARRIMPRLHRRLRLAPPAPAPAHAPCEEWIVLERTDQVELAAAAHYAESWDAVHYVENRLMNALFGLAFWEEIFAPVPGAFVNPFQDAPLDMYDARFLQRRRARIEARIERLGERCLGSELLRCYDRYRGYRCRWVDWEHVDRDLLCQAAQRIPARHLLSVWRRQLFDPRANRSGFPDLIAFDRLTYCLIEVKGPGDSLNDNQRRWLSFFAREGIPAKVARVVWAEDEVMA